VRCASDGWLPLLPGLIEVRAQSLDLRLAGANSAVGFSGRLRLFRRSDNQWHLERDATFALRGAPFEVPLLTGAQIALLPTSGLIFRRIDTALVFGRRQSGMLCLRLDKVRASFGGWPAAGFDFPEINADNVTPSGSHNFSPTARSWQDVPGVGSLQYRATAPDIEVNLNGSALSARLLGGIEVRVKGTQPNGQPFPAWSAGLSAPISATGTLQLPLPAHSILQVPLTTARSSCETLARSTQLRPLLPQLPGNFSVSLSSVIS
jgi:hypothetical protein